MRGARDGASISITHYPGVSGRFAFFRRGEPLGAFLSVSFPLSGQSRFESKRADPAHGAIYHEEPNARYRECPVNGSNAKGVKREGSTSVALSKN